MGFEMNDLFLGGGAMGPLGRAKVPEGEYPGSQLSGR